MRELLDGIVRAAQIPARYLTASDGGSEAEVRAAMDEYLHVIRRRFYRGLERRMLRVRGAVHKLSKPRRGPYRRRGSSIICTYLATAQAGQPSIKRRASR